MKIAIAQIDPVVGAFEANVKKIKEAYQRACSKQARLLLTPELGVCGYPPHDLVERPEMFERNEKAIEELMALTRGQKCALAVGHISRNPEELGRAAQNVVTILEDGRRVFRQAKSLLPTYDVFDESRYFEPAKEIKPWICDGKKIGIAICEDLWAHDTTLGRTIYQHDPLLTHKENGVDLLLSASASPYFWGKRERREELHRDAAKALGCPLIYVNQVGATDEILFDGSSFAVDAKGELIARLPVFRNSFGVIELHEDGTGACEVPGEDGREDEAPSEIESLYRGLVLGIREYFSRTGFKVGVLGLSGGIDSSVVAALAVQALGAKSVLGVAMPSQYSSGHSLEDAEQLARNLGMPFEVRPIKFLFATTNRELSEGRGALAPLAQENLQARLRGLILMTLSNHYSALVFTTGNKSELAVGYCTMYGDMVGALAPLGDLFKTRVYELAQYINQVQGNVIPDRCLTKAPSAELRPNQTDQDSLPPYEALDELLEGYIEKKLSLTELEAKFADRLGKAGCHGKGWVRETLQKVELNEYKRRQAAPVLKVSPKAFGIGRRIPITRVWDV